MKLLVIGGGGREHAIIKKLKENPQTEKIWCCPGNGGIANDAECVAISATDIEKQIAFAKEKEIDYVVVTPDDPLALGAVDAFTAAGFPCFGPEKKAAIIEASKVFAKELMAKYAIPTAAYVSFDKVEEAEKYLDSQKLPIVIKADGLALGKGVIIAQSLEEAKEAVREMMLENKFGSAGSRVVIEEFLTGPEVSVLCFTDGKTLVPMVSSMDHKRAHDNDEGLNTGGMGAIAPNPCYTEAIAKEAYETIFMPTLKAMEAEGRTFKGCLYFSLMLTEDGPKVIEYNSRFGDPETQAVLPLLESDLLTIFQACTNGTLDQQEVVFKKDSSCCLVIASKGYPEHYEKGFPVEMSEEALKHCDFAGVKLQDGKLVSSGGRVLGITCTAPTLKEAIAKSYALAKEVKFENGFCRGDIGQRALKALEA
ncbi:MAG: phosphoribosylamine--glycine ligase [Erysipelotrichaceae bacterium]|nr:phosphoribosylamine--glycine ligase [Erysipelotrichaceae bacterium]